MDFVKFLNDNSLRKKEIAEYLGIAPSNLVTTEVVIFCKYFDFLFAESNIIANFALGLVLKDIYKPTTAKYYDTKGFSRVHQSTGHF